MTLNIADNQESEKCNNNSYISEGFIPDVSLLNDLMKILLPSRLGL